MINTTWHISHQTFVLMKTPWRCLSSSSSEDVFKTSWSWGIYSPYSYVFRWRLDQDQYIRLGHTSSRHFPQVFKMSSRHLQDVSKMFQDVLKTSSGHLQDFFKTSSRHLQDVLQRCLKTLSRRIIKLNCSCYTISRCLRDLFKTFLRSTAKTVI